MQTILTSGLFHSALIPYTKVFLTVDKIFKANLIAYPAQATPSTATRCNAMNWQICPDSGLPRHLHTA